MFPLTDLIANPTSSLALLGTLSLILGFVKVHQEKLTTHTIVFAALMLALAPLPYDVTWADLRTHLDEREAIELVMLVGHYEMLATAIAALRIQPDERRARRG